jgi:hypothetical protein
MPVIQKLDKTLAIKLMSEAVAERGDSFVYHQEEHAAECRYVHGTEVAELSDGGLVDTPEEEWTPGCLVGAALVKGGVSLKQIMLTNNNESGSDVLLDRLVDTDVLGGVTADAIAVIALAQSLQDRGDSWGYALERAKAWKGDN